MTVCNLSVQDIMPETVSITSPRITRYPHQIIYSACDAEGARNLDAPIISRMRIVKVNLGGLASELQCLSPPLSIRYYKNELTNFAVSFATYLRS